MNEHDEPIRGLFGRLPPIPDKRRLLIGPPTWAIPVPPPSLDHLSPIYPQDMGGNDIKGNCVVVAARTSLFVSWHWLCPDEPHPIVTAQDCINAYEANVGHLAPDDSGPGLVTEKFLDWLIRNPLHKGDPRTQALAWGSIRDDGWSIRAVDNEFGCGIYGVAIHTPQEFPSPNWGCSGGALLGYHEVGGGRYDPSSVFCNTWGYQAAMSSCYVTTYLDEHHVIIWPHVWDALTPERRTLIATDYQLLTGRPFPAAPIPYEPRPSQMYTPLAPVRIIDTRKAPTSPVPAHGSRRYQVTGLGGIPAGATAITCKFELIAKAGGFANVGPTNAVPHPVDGPDVLGTFGAGVKATYPTIALALDGGLWVYSTSSLPLDFDLEVTGYFTP